MPKYKNNGLSPKQKLFVNEYLVDLNATEAALRAGYSPKSAKVIGADRTGQHLLGGLRTRVPELGL